MIKALKNRFGGIVLLYVIFISLSFISRNVLLGMSYSEVNTSFLSILRFYSLGLFFDTVAFTYFMIPFVLFLIFVTDKFRNSPFYFWFTRVAYFITFFILIFNGVSEYFFWEEFGVRYNFIAVDYLVYTTEVLGNIRESYPIPLIVSLIIIIDMAILYLIHRKGWFDLTLQSKSKLSGRFLTGGALLIFPVISYLLHTIFSRLSFLGSHFL